MNDLINKLNHEAIQKEEATKEKIKDLKKNYPHAKEIEATDHGILIHIEPDASNLIVIKCTRVKDDGSETDAFFTGNTEEEILDRINRMQDKKFKDFSLSSIKEMNKSMK